ncbi:nitrite transporter NirC [Solibacillus sp. R5-41]|uniref:formate/nitrite transporter family protein n=1 Tax=Solibacillus sp. R5-41 TaxID=2048654 RepID=UPI000C125969|nr:formate/nitrite transporter family protein [Solibacillus sp. R5-41]ATP41784.1 nitrite transporter NirC [Solibacillus sp. R5-41]
MTETFQAIATVAEKKTQMVRTSKLGFLILAFYGGLFIGFGIITFIVIGGLLSPTNVPSMKIIQGLAFGVALCMVTLSGTDLFTGNNLVMAIGTLEKRTSILDLINVWSYSYVGNFIGSIFCAWLFFMSGMAVGETANFVEKVTTAKMSAPATELFFRGILCNTLVCIAVWCTYRLKSEAAKIMIIFCCIFPFIMSGFEHSIANMTLFTLAFFIPHGETITLSGAIHNLVPVTAGNIVGGAVVLGLGLWLAEQGKRNEG